MNFKEGIRRLALLAGGLGAIGGSLGSYLELKSALQQKAMHEKFERLAASDDVTKERKCRLLGGAVGCSLDPNANIEAIAEPKDDFADIVEPRSPKEKISMRDDWKKMSRADQDKLLNSMTAAEQTKFASDMGWAPKAQSQSVGGAHLDLSKAQPIASELDRNEIKTINWGEGKDYTIESIETEDGNTLYATLPSRWIYFWTAILPIVGFVLPWGLITSIRWVAAGFMVNKESN